MSLTRACRWVSGLKRWRAWRAIAAWSQSRDMAIVMAVDSVSRSKGWKTMPLLLSMSSGMPPICDPATGVPAHSDSTTLSGLLS